VTWDSRLVGRLMMWIAIGNKDVKRPGCQHNGKLGAPPKGHFLGQMPHPIHRRSEMKAILDSGVTSIQSFPVRTTGHDFLHS